MKNNDLTKYYEVRPIIQTGDIISWKTDNLLGQLIRIFSKGKNHISTVTNFKDIGVDRVYVTEALGSGLQPQCLSERLRKSSGKAWLHKLKQENNKYRYEIRSWLVDRWWTPYGFSDLFDYIDGEAKIDKKRLVCSEAAFLAAKIAGVPDLQNINYSPNPRQLIDFNCYEEGIRIL